MTQAITARLLTIQQAAVYLAVSRSTIKNLISGGGLPVTRSRRVVRIDIKDCDKWIEQNKY